MVRERRTREHQDGSRLGRACTEHTLQHKHTLRRSVVSNLHDVKTEFDSTNRLVRRAATH